MSRRESSARDLLSIVSFLVLFVVSIRVFADERIFAQSIDGRSVYGPNTLTVTNITNSGCTFESTRSVLSKGITK